MRKNLFWCDDCREYIDVSDVSSLIVNCEECGTVLSHMTVPIEDVVYGDNLSVPQRYVSSFLSVLGLVVDTEVNVGTRRVDIYLPEINAAIEYDGPHHMSAKGDAKRDEEVLYGGLTYVFHITDTNLSNLTALRIQVEGAT